MHAEIVHHFQLLVTSLAQRGTRNTAVGLHSMYTGAKWCVVHIYAATINKLPHRNVNKLLSGPPPISAGTITPPVSAYLLVRK
mmetsp:Transcript_73389/g.123613  ORF Transcript_73389/g.123613 Transcript_73389/m.123613 type:complete len:83 (+) Transcript_73389:107-355(+)